MTARGPIAHGVHTASPRAPLRRLVAVTPLRAGPLHGLHGRSAAVLTGPTMTMQPMLTSAARRATTITPGFYKPVIA